MLFLKPMEIVMIGLTIHLEFLSACMRLYLLGFYEGNGGKFVMARGEFYGLYDIRWGVELKEAGYCWRLAIHKECLVLVSCMYILLIILGS